MAIKDVLSIQAQTYSAIKLVPAFSTRNTNTHNLARAIAGMYKDVRGQIGRADDRVMRLFGQQISTRYTYTPQVKVAFVIEMRKGATDFYLIVPDAHVSTLKERMRAVWPDVTMEDGEMPTRSPDALSYQLVYKKEDALSLATDRRDNDLLRSILNVSDSLQDGDCATVVYNLMPTSQFSWGSTFRETMRKVKNKIPVDRDKFGTAYLLKRTLGYTLLLTDDVFEVVNGTQKKEDHSLLDALADRLSGANGVSVSTTKKGASTILNTQIVVSVESEDKQRQRNLARSLTHAFDAIAEDNTLVAKPYRAQCKLDQFTLASAAINKMSELELQNFLALPGRELLERYGGIKRIETQETEVPEELQSGTMCIGTNTYRGHEQKAYLCDDKEFKFLSTVIIGPNRAGKTTLIQNLINDGLRVGECAIVVDFIRNCELSEEIASLFPREKVLRIDCRDPARLQGLGYNEIRASSDPFQQWENAKRQSTLLATLLNSINDVETKLTSKMERYLSSACLAVFLSGGSIKDVFRVLQDHKTRAEWLSRIPEAQAERMEEYVSSLQELDVDEEESVKLKGEYRSVRIVTGTKDSRVVGIIDRLAKLKGNTYLEMMLAKGTDGNIDLVSEFQKPQLICLQMPEAMFPTDPERDLYATYWMTKIWCALQVRSDLIHDRAKMTKVNLIIDELYQVRSAEKFLATILSRLPKFGLKPIISCHYLNQIHQLREELRSASPSYMLLTGCDKKNFAELKEELYPFTVEDLLSMKRYHSMNLVKTTENYARLITALPPKIS